MSRTLNLVDILLTTGRHLVMMGRFTEALEPLTKLSGFRSLPDHALEELQSLLADIHLQQRRFPQARRHLAAAIALKPLKAEYHYLMGIAIEEDERADRKRAEMYLRGRSRSRPTIPITGSSSAPTCSRSARKSKRWPKSARRSRWP